MEVRYPPPTKGVSQRTCAIPHENKAKRVQYPSAILSRKGIARYAELSRIGPLSTRSAKASQFKPRFPRTTPTKVMINTASVEVPCSWESQRESRDQTPKSLEKVSWVLPAPVPKVRKESRKRSDKSPRTHFQALLGIFEPFSRLFWTFGTWFRETFSRIF